MLIEVRQLNVVLVYKSSLICPTSSGNVVNFNLCRVRERSRNEKSASSELYKVTYGETLKKHEIQFASALETNTKQKIFLCNRFSFLRTRIVVRCRQCTFFRTYKYALEYRKAFLIVCLRTAEGRF